MYFARPFPVKIFAIASGTGKQLQRDGCISGKRLAAFQACSHPRGVRGVTDPQLIQGIVNTVFLLYCGFNFSKAIH